MWRDAEEGKENASVREQVTASASRRAADSAEGDPEIGVSILAISRPLFWTPFYR